MCEAKPIPRPPFPDLTEFHKELGLTPDTKPTLSEILLQMREEERA